MSVDEHVPYSFGSGIEMTELPRVDLCAGVILYVGPDKNPRIGWDEPPTSMSQTLLVREQKTMMSFGMSGSSDVLNYA